MIYLDHSSTSHPKAPGVAQAVASLLEQGCFNINRGSYDGAYSVAEQVFETRQQLAKLFHNKGRSIVFTSGATAALNLALKGILQPGDRVLTTPMEHNAVLRPLRQLSQRGIVVEMARCDADGSLDLVDFKARLSPRTKLVVVNHASNVCGTIQDIQNIGAIVKENGALFLVDSAQTAGIIPIDMVQSKIDMLAFAGHKGLLAMPGIGGLALSDTAATLLKPLIAGGTGSHSDQLDMPTELPDRLEAGTMNLPGIISLGVSLTYLERLGIETIRTQETRLLAYLTEGLQKMPELKIIGTTDLNRRVAIVALDFPQLDNATVSAKLDSEYGIMTRCGLHCAPLAHKTLGTYPQGVVRCSLGHQNTIEEIDHLLKALSAIMESR